MEQQFSPKLISYFEKLYGAVKYNVEHQKMLADIKNHGINNDGVYRGIKWRTNRPYETYLCGYICLETNINDLEDVKLNNIERKSHKGLTSELGFDCAHAGDYFTMSQQIPGSNYDKNATYKDHDYVVKCLHNMIDAYLDTDENDE